MDFIDLIIGALLMNAMPHLIMGITQTRFLGLFGFSPKGNILYSSLQFGICLLLFHWQYGIDRILEHGMFIGASLVLVCFYIFGKLFVKLYKRNDT